MAQAWRPIACGTLLAAVAAQDGPEARQRWQGILQRDREWKEKEIRALREELPFIAARECPQDYWNSTLAIARCAVAKVVDKQAIYNTEKQTELTWQGMEYIFEMEAQAEHYMMTTDNPWKAPMNAIMESFREDRRMFQQAAGAFPRVYVLDTWGDDPECEDPNLGYTYFLEHWTQSFMRHPNQAIVSSVEAADYVYLPFCIRMKLDLYTHRGEAAAWDGACESTACQECPRSRRLRRCSLQRPLAGASLQASSGRVQYLQYEGKLMRSAVRAVDEQYLLGGVQRVAQTPEFIHCMERVSCRFLTASIDGRHVYRNFSSFFGSKLVLMTYMGMTDWATRQPGNLYWTDLHGVSMTGSVLPVRTGMPEGCRAACALNCRLEPPGVLHEDIVMPWTVIYKWTRRSEDLRSRNLLAFFSGSQSSCARSLLVHLYRREFTSVLRTHGPLSAGADLSQAVLVFPPYVRLEQREWSELAYRSHICIVPDGDCAATVRLLEVIMHGCVPMIITNRLLPPLQEYIDWRKIAFFVREDEIPALPGILAWISRERRLLAEMQHRLAEVARFLDYSRDFPSVLLVALRKRAHGWRRPTEDGWGT